MSVMQRRLRAAEKLQREAILPRHKMWRRGVHSVTTVSVEGPMLTSLRDPLVFIVALAVVVFAGEIAFVHWL